MTLPERPEHRSGMKVSDPDPHSRSAGEMQPTVNKTPPVTERPQLRVVRGGDLTFRRIYERWFDDVVKWLYALGVPGSDTEDLAQEVFLVVRRRLSTFEAGNIAAWIYRITELTVRDHRRRAWFKNLIS